MLILSSGLSSGPPPCDLLLQLSQPWPLRGLPCPFDTLLSSADVFSASSLSGAKTPVLESATSPRSPGSFC